MAEEAARKMFEDGEPKSRVEEFVETGWFQLFLQATNSNNKPKRIQTYYSCELYIKPH